MNLKALVFCGDQWHPAADVRRGLTALANPQFDFEFVADGGTCWPERMTDSTVVILAKANHLCATDQRPWLTAETEGAFREFVRGGGGLFLIHGGCCYRNLPRMREVTGGAFLEHPEQCPVTVEPKAGHPLAADVSRFIVKDEHYLMAQDDARADVFLQSRSEHGVQPAGWTRTEGAGRVCVLTPGHNVEVWMHPEFQKLLRNGLEWLVGAT